MPIFVLLLIAAIAGGGVASTSAKPGDSLFPVKLTVETVQETFTFDSKAKANLQADHALSRLKELQANIANGKATGLSTAIANLEEKVKGATDSAKKSGDAALAKQINDRLTEAENEINDLAKSTVTDPQDDSLLGDAKDLLAIEKDRLEAVANPAKAQDFLKDALEKATKEASDSAKKLDKAKKDTASAKTDSEVRDATETKQAIEIHDSIVKAETTTIEKEQAAPAPTSTTTSGSTTKVEDSGTSGKTSTSSGSGSGSGSGH